MPDWLSFSSWHRCSTTVTHSPRSKIFCAPAGRVLQAVHVFAGTVAKRSVRWTQFSPKLSFFILATHFPICCLLFQGMEVEMDRAVQPPVATYWHEQAIHSKITGVEDRGRINDEVMDRLTAVWEKGIKCFKVLSTIFRGEKGHIYYQAFGRMIQFNGQDSDLRPQVACVRLWDKGWVIISFCFFFFFFKDLSCILLLVMGVFLATNLSKFNIRFFLFDSRQQLSASGWVRTHLGHPPRARKPGTGTGIQNVLAETAVQN